MTTQQLESRGTFEITTTAKLSKPLTTTDITSAMLSPTDFEACKSPHYRITIFGKVVFSGKESVYRAILQIVEPKYINDGTIRAEEKLYFNWSHAKKRIVKKYALKDFNYVGTKYRINGIIVSSVVSNDREHQVKVRQIVREITTKFPHVLFSWEKCLRTIACSLERYHEFRDQREA